MQVVSEHCCGFSVMFASRATETHHLLRADVLVATASVADLLHSIVVVVPLRFNLRDHPDICRPSGSVIPNEVRDLTQGGGSRVIFSVIQPSWVRSFAPLRMTPLVSADQDDALFSRAAVLNASRKKGAVRLMQLFATSSGVPVATIFPPSGPASGPRSTM